MGERKLEPLFHPPLPVGASDDISLGYLEPISWAKAPVKELLTLEPVQVKRFTRKARNFLGRPLSTSAPSTTPSSLKKGRGPTRHTLLKTTMCPFRFLSTLPPYSRKPSPFGPNLSVCTKGVSRGVHNIAFFACFPIA